MNDKEIILESQLEQALNRENDHKNCANCFKWFEDCNFINRRVPSGVCSKHEWNKMERMERSYD